MIRPSSVIAAPSEKLRMLSAQKRGATDSRAGIDMAAAIASIATAVAAGLALRMKSMAAAIASIAAIHNGTAKRLTPTASPARIAIATR